MAILKSADGKFYDVPEDKLESLEIPADQVKDRLTEAGGGPSVGGGLGPKGGGGGAPQVLIKVYGRGSMGGAPMAAGQAANEVEPYDHHHCHHCHRCHRCHHCHHCH